MVPRGYPQGRLIRTKSANLVPVRAMRVAWGGMGVNHCGELRSGAIDGTVHTAFTGSQVRRFIFDRAVEIDAYHHFWAEVTFKYIGGVIHSSSGSSSQRALMLPPVEVRRLFAYNSLDICTICWRMSVLIRGPAPYIFRAGGSFIWVITPPITNISKMANNNDGVKAPLGLFIASMM